MHLLRFNFRHPVKGTVRLFNKADPACLRVMPLDTYPDHNAVISLDGLCAGKWKATLEWEHDGRNYVYTEDFEIKQ